MALKTAFVFVFGLAGGLAIPAKQPEENVSLAIASPQPPEIRNTFNQDPLKSTRLLVPRDGQDLSISHPQYNPPFAKHLSIPQHFKNPFLQEDPIFSSARLAPGDSQRLFTKEPQPQGNPPLDVGSSAPQEIKNNFNHDSTTSTRLLAPEEDKDVSAKLPQGNVPLAVFPEESQNIKNTLVQDPMLSLKLTEPGAEKESFAKQPQDNVSLVLTSPVPQGIRNTFIQNPILSSARLTAPKHEQVLSAKPPQDSLLVEQSSIPQEIKDTFIQSNPTLSSTSLIAPEGSEGLSTNQSEDKVPSDIVSTLPQEIKNAFTQNPVLINTRLLAPEAEKDLSAKHSQDIPLSIVPSVPHEIKLNTNFTETSTRLVAPEPGMQPSLETEWTSKVHNLSARAASNSFRCLDGSGSEVMCPSDIPESVGEKAEDHHIINGEEDLDDKMRGERCLLTMAKPKGLLQSTLGQGLKGMSTEERLAEFRKRVEALRRKPSLEIDKTEECDRDSKVSPERESTPHIFLPVSPFSGKNLGGKFGDGRKEVKTDEGTLPIINSNLGETYKESEKESESEEAKAEIVGERKESVGVNGDIAKSSSCLAIPPIPVQRTEVVSGLQDSSGHSTIKLPAQFLGITRLRERLVDVDSIPDEEDEKPIDKGKQTFRFLHLPTSYKAMEANAKPVAPLKLPETLPLPPVVSPPKISLQDEILGNPLPTTSIKLPVLSGQKDNSQRLLEPEENNFQYEKQEKILEGIIAIPEHVKISKQCY